MAETRPTASATSVKATSVQPKRSGNSISWIAPVFCIVAGYCIWRFILGDSSHFSKPDASGGFWPQHEDAKDQLHRIYTGGIIVPLLIGLFLMVITFSIERFLTISRALGKGSIADFIRKVQYHLANRNIDAALAECDKQRGSVANVMKAGLRRYKEMMGNTELDTDQKVISIQKEVEE
ncbi:MAG TPA: MotA/TolQ/ExbB proton channel family protein, partial [Flavisolibacter sp.]|nr:MotA/TolQ/ExbB proton channel family protein [Flavisolibacter sp.]